jgi:transcriptional regulator with XRE-family HTH domain
MTLLKEMTYVPISLQTQLLRELAAGPDGGPIAESRLVYLQERLRGRFFDFLLSRFEAARERGLTQAKLARRIKKSPEVINRWLSAPANLTLDSISDLFAGISAEEPEFSTSSLLGRAPVNDSHLNDTPDPPSVEQKMEGSALDKIEKEQTSSKRLASIEEAGL